jgi:histone deacetylase complex subunit SAP18
MSSAPPAPAKIDRQTTVPFLLKLFYRSGSFHRLDEFSVNSPLPPHLQIYTWQSCSLRELTSLLTSALPNLLPTPAAGTRVAFRLVYPDTRASSNARPGDPGRYMTKDLGSVVVGSSSADSNGDTVMNGTNALEGEAEKTLLDARFVIGDYVSCAVVPPLASGAVAPPPGGPSMSSSSRGGYGGGMGQSRGYGGPRDDFRGQRDGFGGPRDHGFGRGGYGRGPQGGGPPVPMEEWRRGEQVPYGGDFGGSRPRGRGGGRY